MSQLIKLSCHTEQAKKPEIIFPMALGLHLFSSENILIETGKKTFVETGVSVTVPRGFYAQVVGRYSMTTIGVYVSTVTYDHNFFGPLRILMTNESRYDLPIEAGDKIAEILILPLDPPMVTVDDVFRVVDVENFPMMVMAEEMGADSTEN